MNKLLYTAAAIGIAGSYIAVLYHLPGGDADAPKYVHSPLKACQDTLTKRVSPHNTGFQINNAVTENDGTIHIYYHTTTEILGRTIGTEREVAECKNGALRLISQEAKESSY